ncbi:MAG: thymidylate synthase [Anaerostipes sp.]|nr:thymidylate synthase [Anaerostipes sp.]
MKKNRKLKRLTRSKHNMIMELINLCLKIQEGQDGEIECRNAPGKPAVFLEISGHVAWFELRVFENGWEPGVYCDKHFNFYLDRIRGFSKSEFKECRDYLLKLI